MSANLEKAIQDELRELTDDQQRLVMAFVESLRPKTTGKAPKRYSFVGIAHSGNGSLSIEAESILDEAADRREGVESELMTALLDTGFLLAVLDADDSLHAACAVALESETNPVLPDVVLPELAYLILRELGYSALTKFLRAVAEGELLQAQSADEDLLRAARSLGEIR